MKMKQEYKKDRVVLTMSPSEHAAIFVAILDEIENTRRLIDDSKGVNKECLRQTTSRLDLLNKIKEEMI